MLGTRLITTAIGVVILISVLLFSHTAILDIGVMALIAIAMWEIFSTMGYWKNKALSIICFAFAIFMPLFSYFPAYVRSGAVYVLIIFLFCLLLLHHESMSVEQIGIAFLFTYFLPLALTTIISIRRLPNGEHLIYLAFMIPWLSDSSAYIFGRLFGKKKMCPAISPNKTIVGAVSGIIGGGIGSPLIFMGVMMFFFDHRVINLIPLLLCCLLCAGIAEIGDLSASIIKRRYEVKDFGNLFPGHGGVMDRFDSVIFVMPLFYTFLKAFQILV
jgi:phosphatidate cytidylyltransferase